MNVLYAEQKQLIGWNGSDIINYILFDGQCQHVDIWRDSGGVQSAWNKRLNNIKQSNDYNNTV